MILRWLSVGVLGVACFASAPAVAARQITVDGLAAVVGGDPIFLSDVRHAARLQLLDPTTPLAALMAARSGESEARILDRLIDRRLVLAEIARYAPLHPLQTEIDEAMRVWHTRAAEASVDITGVDAIATAFITDTLRIERYIAQRFTAAAHPTRDEAQAWFDANRATFARDGVVPEFDDVEDEVRATLGEERRIAMVREWLDGLRARAQVQILMGGAAKRELEVQS